MALVAQSTPAYGGRWEVVVTDTEYPKKKGMLDLFDALAVGVNVWRLEDRASAASLRLEFRNKAAQQIYDEPAIAIGKSFAECFPRAAPDVAGLFRQVILEDRPRTLGVRVYGSDRATEERYLVSAYPLGSNVVAALFENISAEPERRSELHAIIDSATDAVLSKTLDGTILSWNAAAERLYGYSAEEAVGQPISMLLPPDRKGEVGEIIQHLIEGEHVEALETVRLRKDGRAVDVSLTISPIRDSHHQIVAAATIARDITARKQADARMRALAAIVDASFDPMCSIDPDGTVLTWNPAAERLFGYSTAEMVGSAVSRLLVDGDLPEGVNPRRQVWVDGGQVKPFDVQMTRRDGSLMMVSASASPIEDEHGEVAAAAVVMRDLTEHRALEARLRQVQKMEAIGSLASGVAHDFNNVLSVIRSASGVLLHELEDGVSRDLVGEIDLAAVHASALTKQLLAFGRQQLLQPEPTDMNAVVAQTLTLVRTLLSQEIEIVTELASGLPLIEVDRNQFEQIILNLAANAGDAMPDGGTLTVRTRAARLDADYVADHPDVDAGLYVVLEVNDSGVGIDAPTREYIFDPFFTTKESGTGLGLATVYGIVKQSGGHLAVYSEVGQGTNFKAYLPLAEPSAVVGPERVTARGPNAGGETILLVDDFEGLRKVIDRLLRSAGYKVLVAVDGLDALEQARAHDGPIDLLLTDVVMPNMGGRELSEVLRHSYPEMEVVFTSGYPGDTLVRADIEAGKVAFMQKPFTNAELLTTIAELFA